MTQQSNYFAELNRINVSDHIERKGGFAYLSWPYAVAQLRLADASAVWEVRRFDGKPYLATETGVFVEVAVTVQGITLSQIHPVLDGRNRPLLAPTSFDINTSLQRCLVKAIALHGLGLYIYAGEDLPDGVAPATAANDAEMLAPKRRTNGNAARAQTSTGETDNSPAEPVTPTTTAVSVVPTTTAHFGLIGAEQCARIEQLLEEVGGDRDRLLAYFGVDALDQIRASDYPRVLRSLEKRRAA